MWRASTPKSGRWKNNPVSPIVGSWWALWIISGIAGQAVFRLSLKAETLDEIRMWSFLGLFSEVLDIPLCIVALMMLQQLYAMQEKKRKRVLGSPDSELRGRSCPSCGEALASKDSICPMCGEEITVARGEW